MAKKSKRRVVPFDELRGRLAESATEGPELACALVAGAFIENAAGNLLENVMIPGQVSDGLLNNPLGILSTASGRADMCYCLGLVDKKTYENAKQVAKIRNLFAHGHDAIGFDNKEVKRLCDSLVAPALVDRHDQPIDAESSKKILAIPRQKLVATALASFGYFRIAYVYRKPCAPVDHNVRCVVSEDKSSVIGSLFFNE